MATTWVGLAAAGRTMATWVGLAALGGAAMAMAVGLATIPIVVAMAMTVGLPTIPTLGMATGMDQQTSA